MYSCHLHLYFTGHPCSAFELIRKMPPLEHFTHINSQSDEPDGKLAAGADVILLNLQGQDVEKCLGALLSNKKPDGKIIVFAEKEQEEQLSGYFGEIEDLWFWPMTDEEIRFRFRRLQRIRKAESDYWQTNQYLETVLSASPNMIWFKDKEGIHKKVNDVFCHIVRKPKGIVEGRDHCFIWGVGPEDALVCAKSDHEVMVRKQTCISEEDVKSGDEMMKFITYKAPLYDLDGSVMGTVGLGKDVTQEQAYKQEVARKSGTLEKIFTSLDCGILCHTLGGHVISVNEAALRILGYQSQEDMVAQGFDMVAHSVLEEDKPRLRSAILSLKNVGDSADIEYRVIHTDGELLHILGNIKLLEEDGRRFYQRFLLDDTARKLAETEREHRKDELIRALCIDYNLVCAFDLNTGRGHTLRVSEENEDLSSIFTREIDFRESMENYIQSVVYEPDRDMMRSELDLELLKRELTNKQVRFINYRVSHDGVVMYYEMKAARTSDLESDDSAVLGLRSVDEATRKEMEQKRLMKDALVQASQANRAKSTFLSNMSHDIRTPMNAIIGFTTLAISHMDQKEQVKAYLEKILTSGNHLLNLINHVLDMSRIESGKMHLEERPCDLRDLVDDLEGIFQSDTSAKNQELSVDTSGIVNEAILCDSVRLNQVLLNIVSNSIKYTNAGGSINVYVTEKAGPLPGYGSYTFRIRDNGIGMSPDFLAHIFEPFEREQTTTISKVQGTGLGMSITKNIVELMNGTIDIQSEQGKGTEVTICLPFRLDSPENAAAREPAGGSTYSTDKPRDTSHLRGIRILLVEDNELNQEIAQILLEDAGFQVDLAENGKVAVDKVAGSPAGYYQVILMDIQMPVMDGYEAAKAIRSLDNKELASIPILAMTANAFEEDRKAALRAGMDSHITKPIETDKLFEALDEVLS